MPKPLTEGQQRLFFGALVVVLVAFGIYLSLGGFSDGGNGREEPTGRDQARGESGPTGQGADIPATVPPSPIPTTATKDMQVLEWLPLSEDEVKAAAATAQGFAAAYGTIDYSKSPEEYYKSMQELATKNYAKTLAKSSGATSLWEEMAEKKAVAEGRADVKLLQSIDKDSVVFVVKVQSITEDKDGFKEDLGDFAVTVVKKGGEWQVFDFQPADAGNRGDG
ncbi:hypothetical protein CDO52_06865 [Nocardiopsis gilva YIM 90087]|uniref:Uncharacterized protein n=1 Tax=Nocardiopsis gilva YIM 90087 TaxID=1235441 RepID=A0A223S340_9ACTN|nr:hypothetical protein [Nocardiopsis gilva]ASU82540.1 hypothetical protein CDO52_06865 [Nocardiopsis gilva YIM 90087]